MRLHSRFRSLLGLLRGSVAWLCREDGISLIMVMGFVIIFSVTTSAIAIEVASNEKSAGRDDKSAGVFALAEAALSYGVDQINTLDPDGTLSVSCQPDVSCAWTAYTGLPGLSAAETPQWYARKTTVNGAGVWNVYARATRGTTTRELELKLGRAIDPESVDLQSWQGVFSNNPPGTCMTLENNAGLVEHVYTLGDLCISNNGYILDDPSVVGPNTTLYVGGRVILANNSYIGTSSAKILRATVVGGCYYGGKSRICSNANQSHIWATEYPLGGTTNITKPFFDLDWYSNASPGPKHPCEIVTGSPPSFDNNTTRDTSLGNINPFSATAYSCKTTSGEITWTPGSPGKLTVNGVIFFDANLYVTNNVWVNYEGRGTIYFNGDVYLDNNVKICPTDTCTPSFDFDDAMLVLVALHNGVTPPQGTYTFQLHNNAIFQGGAYVVGSVYIANNCQLIGPVVADGFDLKNNAGYFTPLGDEGLPPGTPVNGDEAWSVEARSWRQMK